MRPILTAFATSPDKGRGLARDMRVRWALEEVGQPYDVRLVTFAEMKEGPHRALHPFGQIPTYQDGDLTLFESGAIVLHLAQTRPGLLPDAPVARAAAVSWLFAALNTVEPPIVEREQVRFTEGDRAWYEDRLPLLDAAIRKRLGDLSIGLGDREWLGDDFSVGDLMMVMVLRRAEGMGLIEDDPRLAAYVARGTARPAYRRAYDAQAQVYLDAREVG